MKNEQKICEQYTFIYVTITKRLLFIDQRHKLLFSPGQRSAFQENWLARGSRSLRMQANLMACF